MGSVTADIVTISHDRPNHAFLEGVSGTPRVITGPGEYEVAGILIAGIATALEPGSRPRNTAYVFRFEDLVICHLGDLEKQLSNDQVEEIGAIDVLMVPAGKGGALDAVQAAEVVHQLTPRIVIPMHFRKDGAGTSGFESVDGFLREMGSSTIKPENKLAVTRGSLPEDIRVVLLESRRV